MQISLRSQLIAGTAAAVGASAIAMTPVIAVHGVPSITVPSVAQVALAGFDSPITELLSTLFVGQTLVFNETNSPVDAGSWAGSGITDGTGAVGPLLWPAALGSDALGGYSSVGVVPQIIDDALPIISQLGYNGSDYLNVTGDALFGAGIALSEGAWNAIGQVVTLDIPGAINTVIDSISSAGALLLGAGGYVLQNVLAKAQAVVATLVGSIPTLLGVTVAQISTVLARTVQIATDAVAAIGAGSIDGAWNAVVDGLLGPTGVPGTLLNLTIGAGVQTGPISGNTVPATQASIAANFVPSVRTEVQTLVKAITADLQVLPASAAAVPSARAAAAKTVKPAAAVVAATSTEAASSDAAAAPAKAAPARASRHAAAAKAAAAK